MNRFISSSEAYHSSVVSFKLLLLLPYYILLHVFAKERQISYIEDKLDEKASNFLLFANNLLRFAERRVQMLFQMLFKGRSYHAISPSQEVRA